MFSGDAALIARLTEDWTSIEDRPLAETPTDTQAGTLERVRIYQARRDAGFAIFHPADADLPVRWKSEGVNGRTEERTPEEEEWHERQAKENLAMRMADEQAKREWAAMQRELKRRKLLEARAAIAASRGVRRAESQQTARERSAAKMAAKYAARKRAKYRLACLFGKSRPQQNLPARGESPLSKWIPKRG